MARTDDAAHRDIGMLAGWLFADLLLALFVIFLGAQGGEPLTRPAGAKGSRATTASSTTTTPSTTTMPPPVTKPAGVETTPYTMTISTNEAVLLGPDGPAKDAERARIRNAVVETMTRDGVIGRRAGFVLTFGVHPTVGRGQVIGEAFNAVLKDQIGSVFASAALRNFDYRSSAGKGDARVEVYFLSS